VKSTSKPSHRGGVKGFTLAFAAIVALGFLAFVPLSPAGCQAVASLSKVQHLRTDSFDIYFPDSLAAQGLRLAGFADDVLSDLKSFFGMSSSLGSSGWPFAEKRIPVLLSDVEYSLNGYFTPYSSNRIVIYPKAAGPTGELASFEDELRSVFIHELTHVVTLNMRSSFWAALASMAGDAVAPAAWVMPNALVEGTAVWIESGRGLGSGLDGSVAGGGLAAAGRLSDPAALEPVFMDLSQGRRRGLWDVSGVADYSGAGSMPYLYGALFSRYLEDRYGSESLAELWRMAAKGNIFVGFDGTATTSGVLERVTGQRPAALWSAFLDWLEKQAVKPRAASDPAIGAAGGRIGAFCADENRLFYLDQEARAVFVLDLADENSKPVRLFPADGYLEEMRLSGDGSSLELAWIRKGQGGKILPASYVWDIAHRELKYAGDRPIEEVGGAIANLQPASPLPFLYARQLDPISGYAYGLVRMGTRTSLARVSPDGDMDILDSPLAFIRSMSLWPQPSIGSNEAGGIRIVMSAAQPGGLTRIVILDGTGGAGNEGWKLQVQKLAPAGGASKPVLAGRTRIIYRAGLADGRQELRAADADDDRLASDYEALGATWKPLETARREFPPLAAAEPRQAEELQTAAAPRPAEILSPALFPRLLASSRFPYADMESLGLTFHGHDLTERLAWNAAAGWDFKAALPEASLALGLSIDEQYFALAFADSTQSVSGGTARILSAGLGHGWTRSLRPINRRLWTSETLSFAGLDPNYSIAGYFHPAFSYTSIGGGIDIGYSTMSLRPFAPFDRQGLSFSTGLDYEILPGTASAASFSGALSLALPRPASILSLYGALAPNGALLFHPAGRYYSVAGQNYPSAIAAPYPAYKAYEGLNTGSSWYCFGELAARPVTFELWKKLDPVPMPFLPSWTLRRISLWTGLRAALLDRGGSPALPYSAFARAEIDAALLAGLAAEGHIGLNLEASWAFAPELAGGRIVSLDFGFGVTY
jgi:hypothetical protein